MEVMALRDFKEINFLRPLGRVGGGGVGCHPLGPRSCFTFMKWILFGHLSISVAVRLSLIHIYCEFGENPHIHIGDIK